ncbi:MAG: terminase family protein [Spirochaetaceae bacterium]|nr:terminase family protein [Spirochaetaceae bacterium]
MRLTKAEARDLLFTLSPPHYIKSLGFKPYQWQEDILKSGHRRKVINGARQAGKSTIVCAKPCHVAKHYPGSVSIIAAPTEQQAFYDMEKVKAFINRDAGYPEKKRNSDRLIELENKSWILVVPATETSARGPSAPRLILLDEASRIEDAVYHSGILPMLNNNPECELICISTPNGQQGFFYESYGNPAWERYEVRSPWDVIDIEFRLAEGEPEEEYRRRLAEKNIRGCYSPRHGNREEQEFLLKEMGTYMYRQENRVEFVEPKDQIFSYDEIERLRQSAARPVAFDEIGTAEPLLL